MQKACVPTLPKPSSAFTTLIDSGRLGADLGLPPLDATQDRATLCGNPALLKDMREILTRRGFAEGNTTTPGAFVVERTFVAH
jgi:ferredoxin--NADP+ reductase